MNLKLRSASCMCQLSAVVPSEPDGTSQGLRLRLASSHRTRATMDGMVPELLPFLLGSEPSWLHYWKTVHLMRNKQGPLAESACLEAQTHHPLLWVYKPHTSRRQRRRLERRKDSPPELTWLLILPGQSMSLPRILMAYRGGRIPGNGAERSLQHHFFPLSYWT